jgi:hypothetical protein
MRNHGSLPQISQTSKTACLRQPVPANANANCSLREIADAEMQAGGADVPIFGLCVPSPIPSGAYMPTGAVATYAPPADEASA